MALNCIVLLIVVVALAIVLNLRFGQPKLPQVINVWYGGTRKMPQEIKVRLNINVLPGDLKVVAPDGSKAGDGAVIQLPDAKVGQLYDYQLKISGGTSPDTITAVGGALPDGLEIDETGHITGTIADDAVTSGVDLDIKDSGQ